MYNGQNRPKWPNIHCEEYRKIMHPIITGIRQENFQMTMYLCKDVIPQNLQFNDFLNLLEFFERSGRVGKHDISMLAEILYRINRIDLLKKLFCSKRKFEDDFLSQGYTHFTPFRILMFELTEELGNYDFTCLKHQCSDYMKQRLLDDATDIVSLLTKLEELGVVESDDLKALINLLGLVQNTAPFHKFQRLQQGDFTVILPERFQPRRQASGTVPFNTENPIANVLNDKKKQFKPPQYQMPPTQHAWSASPETYPGPNNSKVILASDQSEKQKFVRYNPNLQFQVLPETNMPFPETSKPFTSDHQSEVEVNKKSHFPVYYDHEVNEPVRSPPPSYQYYQNPQYYGFQPPQHQQWRHHSSSAYAMKSEDPYNPYQPAVKHSYSYPNMDNVDVQPYPMQSSQVRQQQTNNLTHEMKMLDIKESIKSVPNADPNGKYKMDRNPVGVCLLINNVDFEENKNMDAYNRLQQHNNCPRIDLEDREGSNIDADAIENLFTGFSFVVDRHNNVKYHDMQRLFQEYASKDYSDYDCFACVILSHGQKNIVYSVDGFKYRLSDMQGHFTLTTSLSEKPKLFFVQACAGTRKMEKHPIPVTNNSDVQTDGDGDEAAGTPILADFLLAHATAPGFVSYRSISSGSWFISDLVKNFKRYYKTEDLLSIIVRTNGDVSNREHVQIPMPYFTLRKKVFFTMLPEHEVKLEQEHAQVGPSSAVAKGAAAMP